MMLFFLWVCIPVQMPFFFFFSRIHFLICIKTTDKFSIEFSTLKIDMQQSYLKLGKLKKKSTLFVHKVSLASLITETLIYFKEKQSCLKQMCSDWRRDALEGSNSRLDGHSLNVSVLSKGNEPQEDCNCNHYFALCLKHQNIFQNRFFGRVRAQCHSTLKPSAETISGGFFHWFLCGVLMSADLEG